MTRRALEQRRRRLEDRGELSALGEAFAEERQDTWPPDDDREPDPYPDTSLY